MAKLYETVKTKEERDALRRKNTPSVGRDALERATFAPPQPVQRPQAPGTSPNDLGGKPANYPVQKPQAPGTSQEELRAFKPPAATQPVQPMQQAPDPTWANVPKFEGSGPRYDRIKGMEEQKRLRGSLRDKQEGFRTLDPSMRDQARGEMADIRNAHRGISAKITPQQPTQTPEQVQANRATLASYLSGELRKQETAGQGRMDQLTGRDGGAGLRQASVDAGARMAPGIARYNFSGIEDQYNQRDTLALAGRAPGQPDWNSRPEAGEPLRPSAKDLAVREEKARLAESLGRVREAIPRAESGEVFGPAVSSQQLDVEATNRAAQRDATMRLGDEASGRITSQRAERDNLRSSLAKRAQLGVDAENYALTQVVEGKGQQDLNNRIAETEAQTRLAESQGQRRAIDRDRAVQDSRYDTAQAATTFRDGMERVKGALFTDGVLFGGRGNVDGSPVFRDMDKDVADAAFIDATVVGPLEVYAKADPVRAAQDAKVMLSQMPPARSDGTYGVSGTLLKSQSAVKLAETLNSMRRRLEAIASAGNLTPPPAPSGT